jgi:glycerol-3-phosphate acyltransferase PlsY
MIAGFGSFVGHLFPLWLRFKGGKGVATYIGVLAALAWPAALVFAAVWLVIAVVTRYSSLAALLASAATPLVLWLNDNLGGAMLFVVLTVLVWITHRTNIARLLAGTESKIGKKEPVQAA